MTFFSVAAKRVNLVVILTTELNMYVKESFKHISPPILNLLAVIDAHDSIAILVEDLVEKEEKRREGQVAREEDENDVAKKKKMERERRFTCLS